MASGDKRLRGLLLALLMLTSAAVQPVGADVLEGGTASVSEAGNAPAVVINDAKIENGTSSSIEVAYDVNGTGQDVSNLTLELFNASDKTQLDQISLPSKSGTVNLTIPPGLVNNFTAVVRLVNSSNRNLVANDTATITVVDESGGGGGTGSTALDASNSTYDPTTVERFDVDYNVTGTISSASSVGIVAYNATTGNGTQIASNTSLTSLSGVATISVPAGTLSGDVVVEYRLVNTSSGTVLNTVQAGYSASSGGETTTETPVNLTRRTFATSQTSGDDPPTFTTQLSVQTNQSLEFAGGQNYTVELVREGSVAATLVANGSMSVPDNGSIRFIIHEADGTPRSTALLSSPTSKQPESAEFTVVSGSIPKESGIVNYSIRLRDASTGDLITTTEPSTMAFAYSGELNATVADGTVTLSLPRDLLPESSSVAVRLSNATTRNTVLSWTSMSYDSATNSYRLSVSNSTVPNGTYAYRAEVTLPDGTSFVVTHYTAGNLTVGNSTNGANETTSDPSRLSYPIIGATFNPGDPLRVSSLLNVVAAEPVALDQGRNYKFRVYQDGQYVATFAPEGTVTVPAGEWMTLEIYDADGRVTQSPVLSTDVDGKEYDIGLSVVNGSLPSQPETVNVSVGLVNATTDAEIDRTRAEPVVFGYAGELNVSTGNESVTLSVPRDVLPTGSEVTVELTEDDYFGSTVLTTGLSYDPANDSFRTTVPKSSLSNGTYGYDVEVSLPNGTDNFSYASTYDETVQIQAGSIQLNVTHPRELGTIGRGDDPQKLSNRLTFQTNQPLTFDRGSNYEVRVLREGEVAFSAVVTENVTVPRGERFAFEFHATDGSARSSPVLTTFADGERKTFGVSILSGSVPDESGLANYSLRFVDASTGDVVDSTDSTAAVYDYAGELNATVENERVTLSIPRSSLPEGTTATLRVYPEDTYGTTVLSKTLTYDSATDTYRVQVSTEALPPGTYEYSVSFRTPGDGQFDVGSNSAGELTLGSVTISGVVTGPDGSPATGDDVLTFYPEFVQDQTNSSGGFSFDVAPGTDGDLWYYQRNGSGFGVRDGVVDIYGLKEVSSVNSDIYVEKQLPKGYVVNVTVVDESGDPVDDANVSVGIYHDAFDTADGYHGAGLVNISMNEDGQIITSGDNTTGFEMAGPVNVTAEPRDDTRFSGGEIQRNIVVTSKRNITIVLPEEDQSPVARLTTNTSNLIAGETVLLDASESRDNGQIVGGNLTVTAPDGTVTRFDKPTVQFTPEQSGEYTVTLTIRDAAGNTNTTQTTFTSRIPADVSYNYELQNVVAGQIGPNETLTTAVTVTNDGDLRAERTVALVVDGSVVTTKDVTLAGGESTTVSFDSDLSTGAHNVTINELPSRTVTVQQPANLTVSYDVSSTQLFTSDPLTVNATVSNVGGVEGTRNVSLTVDGQTVTETVTVPSGETRALTFSTRFDSVGTKIVGVDNLATTAVQVQRATNQNAMTTITSPADGATKDVNTLTVGYSVSNADTGIAEVVYRVDGGTWQTVKNGLDSSSVGVDLSGVSEGQHTITVALRDNLGNEIAASDVSVVIDRTAPTLGTTVVGGTTVGPEETVQLDVTGSDATLNVSNATLSSGGTVVETIQLADRLADGQATVSVDTLAGDGTTLASGSYTLQVTVTDEAGHRTQQSTTVTVDTDAPSLSSLSTSGGQTSDGVRYLNASTGLSVSGSVSDTGASGVANRTVVLVAEEQTFNYSTTVSASGGSFLQSISPSSANLPDGNYSVVVSATDGVGNADTKTNVGTFTYDSTTPTLGTSIVAQDATTGKVVVTSDEQLSSAPTVEVELPDGTNKTLSTTKQSTGNYTTTFSLGTDGEYTATATGKDPAGNADSETSKTKIQTNIQVKNQKVTIETGDGSFIRLKLTTDDIDGALASLTSSDTPLAALGSGLTGSQFIEGELGSKLSGNLSHAKIGIPEEDVTLPPGIAKSQIDIRRYNASQNRWNSVGTTSVESVKVNGTTDTYFLVNVSHFSTYGAVSTDQNAPTVDSTSLSPTEPSDGTFDYSTDEVTTTVSYSDDVSGVNASAVVVEFDGTPVSQLSDVSASVTKSDATITATELTGSGSHTVTVTVEDETGKTTTTSTSFTVAQDTTAPSLSTSLADGTQLAYGTSSKTIRVDYTDALSGVDTSSVTVKLNGSPLSASQTTVDSGYVEFTVQNLQPGDSPTVKVTADDDAGNSATLTRQFSVASDDDGPSVTDTSYSETPVSQSPTEFAPTTTQVTTTLSITDALSGVNASAVSVAFGSKGSLSTVTSGALVTDSKVEYTATGLSRDTTYVLRATLVDEDGNSRQVTREFTVRPDTTAPSVTSTSYSAGSGSTSPPFADGTSSVDVTLSITDNLDAVATNSVTVEFGEQGNLRDVTSKSAITTSSVLYGATDLSNDTTYVLRVTLVDDAGNTRTVSKQFDIGSGSSTSNDDGSDEPSGFPTAALSAPDSVTVGETVTLDASGSTDNSGIVTYKWDFDGDGTFDARTSSPTVQHTFETTGDVSVTVKAIDSAGKTDTAQVTVSVESETATTPTDTPDDSDGTEGTPTDTPGETPTDTPTSTATDTPTDSDSSDDTPDDSTGSDDTPTDTPADGTPTETVTETAEPTDAPDGTDTATTTGTSTADTVTEPTVSATEPQTTTGRIPGFTGALTLIALLGAALIALRRRE